MSHLDEVILPGYVVAEQTITVFNDLSLCFQYTSHNCYAILDKACRMPNATEAGHGNITMIFPINDYPHLIPDDGEWVPLGTQLTVTCQNYTHILSYSTIECTGSQTDADWNATLPHCQRKNWFTFTP